MSWPLVLAAGGPRERGRMYGQQSAERIGGTLALYEQVFDHYAGLPWSEVRTLAGAFVEDIEGYDTQLLPELEGIAEGAGVEPEDLLAANLRTDIMFGLDARPGRGRRAAARPATPAECTSVACAADGGSIIVAQNWDWKPASRDNCVILACAPEGAPAFVTFVEAGLWGKCGTNEAGIGLTTNALQSNLDKGEPGVPFHAIVRRILTSSSLEEARAAVRDARRSSSANYLIGSREGRIVNLEAAPGGPDEVYETETPCLVHANHFLRPSPRPFKDVGRIEGTDSPVRQARAEAMTRQTPSSVDAVLAVLRSREDGADSVCAHGDPRLSEVEDYVTVAAVIADLTEGTLTVTDSDPCRSSLSTYAVRDLTARARAASVGV